MKQRANQAMRSLLAAPLFFTAAASAYGAMRHVANNGVDGSSCGTAASPCRSISQAIANAAAGDTVMVGPGLYGDLNADGTLGGPGEETPAPDCRCMLAVNKPVTLLSTDGAAATVIFAEKVAIERNVAIISEGVEFGRPEHGFTVTATVGRFDFSNGIVIDGTNIKVRGNQVIGNFPGGQGMSGIWTLESAETVLIEQNQVMKWISGIEATGAANTVRKNHLLRNFTGIEGIGVFIGNVLTGNFNSIRVSGDSSVIGNAMYGNFGVGVLVTPDFVGVVQKNNIFANSFAVNCGLFNEGVSGPLNATMNFWGAATGPGPDPADAACNEPLATTITSPFAIKPFPIDPNVEP